MRARRAAAGLAGVALVLTLAGCPSEPAPRNPRIPAPVETRQGKAAPTPATVVEAVKGLCDFFVARAHETLLKAEAEGNVTALRSTPGFPADLSDYARAYYLVNATVPIDASERASQARRGICQSDQVVPGARLEGVRLIMGDHSKSGRSKGPGGGYGKSGGAHTGRGGSHAGKGNGCVIIAIAAFAGLLTLGGGVAYGIASLFS